MLDLLVVTLPLKSVATTTSLFVPTVSVKPEDHLAKLFVVEAVVRLVEVFR